MFFKDVAAEFIYFALKRNFKTRFFKTEVKPTYSTKQRGSFEICNRNRGFLFSVALQVNLNFSIIL